MITVNKLTIIQRPESVRFILLDQTTLSHVCDDLVIASFCVPLIDKYSPLVYAIIIEVHWYNDDAKHSGNEITGRFVQTIAHIIEGKSLIKQFRKECPRCHYLIKKSNVNNSD